MKQLSWGLLILLYLLYVPMFLLLYEGFYEAIAGIVGLVMAQWVLAVAIDEIIE